MSQVAEAFKYHESLDQLQIAAQSKLAPGAGAIFATQQRKKLMNFYIKSIEKVAKAAYPDHIREIVQHYNCSQCARFMSRVGHLVVEGEQGLESVFWNPTAVTDPFFKEVVTLMKRFVEEGRVTTLFNPEGPYKTYQNITKSEDGEQTWQHYFIQPNYLRHRYAGLDREISFDEFHKTADRVNSLIKITKEVDLPTVMWVEQMFQARTLDHLENSEATIKSFADLLANLQVAQSLVSYTSANDYQKETILVNQIWVFAVKHRALAALRNSMLGKLLLEAAKLMKLQHRTKAHEMGLVSFWKSQTSSVNYRRTKAPASSGQLERTANFLKDNDWLPSLQQREASEKEIPALWVAKDRWTWIEGKPMSAQTDFTEFASRKGVEVEQIKAPITMDIAYFFNEVLKHVDALGVDMTDMSWKPSLLNVMANMDAKPIFKWDVAERRAPFIPWTYNQLFRAHELLSDKSVSQNGRIILPVLSLSTSSVVGYHNDDTDNEAIMFWFHGIAMPYAPHPALMADGIKNELYEHRRAIEDYSRETQLPRCEGQQAIGLVFGPRHPNQTGEVKIVLHARLNAAGQVLFGAKDVRFVVDGTGYRIKPQVAGKPVIRERNAVAEPEVAPVAPSAATAQLSI
ncbi:hypothetical protein D3C73_173980 [compost metagenome]